MSGSIRPEHCTSEGESAEHLFLKNLISIVAQRLGWLVETEKHGETPDGEKWVADVYCEKGRAKLAFEVQWSHQTRDDFIARQRKYTSSGIRAAWLFRLKSNKQYWIDDIPNEYETPVFGMKTKSKGIENLYITQFDEPIHNFIQGMLEGKLKWIPKIGDLLKAEVIPHYERCWKCKKETGIVLGVTIKNSTNEEVGFQKFSDEGTPEFLLQTDISEHLRANRIGEIKKRFSKTVGGYYLSNGCYHCDAIMGNFFLTESFHEYRGELPDPVFSFQYIHDNEGPEIEAAWYFNGQVSNSFF